MTSRRWCFTVNNPEENLIEQCPRDQLKLLISSLEKGENGTIHLQGYLEMKSPCRLSAMKKLISRAHFEIAKGNRIQAINYCLKDETALNQRWWYWNNQLTSFSDVCPNSLEILLKKDSSLNNGGESNLKLRLSAIQSTLSLGNADDLEKIADTEFDLWVRYYRAFERYLLMKTKPRDFKSIVHVLQGPTGTGKSRWAMENYPNAYWKQRSNWWDGYMGQETVILDEFYGWLPFDLLLRICDRYPLMVETKGGQVQFVAKTIIITTNSLPCNWYKSAYFPSLARRVTEWHVLPVWGEHKSFIDYGEFLKNASENVVSP